MKSVGFYSSTLCSFISLRRPPVPAAKAEEGRIPILFLFKILKKSNFLAKLNPSHCTAVTHRHTDTQTQTNDTRLAPKATQHPKVAHQPRASSGLSQFPFSVLFSLAAHPPFPNALPTPARRSEKEARLLPAVTRYGTNSFLQLTKTSFHETKKAAAKEKEKKPGIASLFLFRLLPVQQTNRD